MLISYLWKRMRRHVGDVLLTALTVTAIVILLLGLHHYYTVRQVKLDAAYEEFEIRCTVTNTSGSRTTDLDIAAGYLDLFSENGTLSPYAKDIFLLRKIANTAVSGTAVTLFMTNAPEASTYLEDAFIQYEEGRDGEAFRGNEPVCIVTDSLLRRVTDEGMLTVTTAWGEISMRVIGSYLSEGENAVFAAWEPMSALLAKSGVAAEAHSMAFTVADNRQLGEAKTTLRKYFAPASHTNKTSNMHGLVMDDSLFIDTVVVLERGLALMRVVRVLVYVLSIGVSFLIAFLKIRTRKLEFAVMRSMGTRSITLYAEVLYEHILMSLLGIVAACCLAVPLGVLSEQNDLSVVGVFMICYLVGVILAVAQVTAGNIMQTLKGKE